MKKYLGGACVRHLGNMGNYYIYRVGQYLAQILPVQLSWPVVRFLCDLHYFFSKSDRQAVENNLKIVMKTDRVDHPQVREVFRNFGKYLLEFFTMKKRLGAAYVKSHVRVNNLDYLDKVMRKGKGGIVVSAHVGNWEMGGAVLPILGYPLSVVALAHKDPKVNALFNAQREAFGAQVIQADVAVRRVLEHLGQNRLVAILADRDFGNRGIIVDFFGRPTILPRGAAFFSMKTGAPIIPMFFIHTNDGRFVINIYPPIQPPGLSEENINENDLKVYIQNYLTAIEEEIRMNPTQWLLFREFWQT